MRSYLLAITLVALASQALASDGAVEINAACASAGCFSGDPPGYPVVITKSGSYRLTGNLAVTNSSLSILDVRADYVTIDLNGFAILGPQTCEVGSCSSTGLGYAIVSFNVDPIPVNTTVVNGTISGFNGCVSLAASGMHVQRLAVSHCTAVGLQVGDDSLVLDNRVSNVRFSGVLMGTNTAYRDNVVKNADLSESGTSFAFKGGRAIGGNVCEDRSCSAYPPRRRFYLSQNAVTGGNAIAECNVGFHMASLWEIWEPSGLRYDTALGRAGIDSGSGPPAEGGFMPSGAIGWVRGLGASISDCKGWTSSGAADTGTVAALSVVIPSDTDPWYVDAPSCSSPDIRVWCVED